MDLLAGADGPGWSLRMARCRRSLPRPVAGTRNSRGNAWRRCLRRRYCQRAWHILPRATCWCRAWTEGGLSRRMN